MSEKVPGIYARDGRPFDYPLAAVDARRWQRLGELSIEQAAFVVAGFEPPPIDVIRFKPIRYQERPGKTWARPHEYNDFVLAADSALQRNQIVGRSDIHKMHTVRLVELPTVLRWARERSFTVASEWEQLEQDVQAATPAPVVANQAVLPEPASGTKPTVSNQIPALKRRRDPLTPVIESAVRACDGRTDHAEVFNMLRGWAQEQTPRQPLLGVTDKGIQWVGTNDEPRELDMKALKKRLNPRP